MKSTCATIIILMILYGSVKPDCTPTFTTIIRTITNPSTVANFVFKGARTSNFPGASVASNGQFPYACEISVNRLDGTGIICTGILISTTLVMSSAYCVNNAKEVLITLGTCPTGSTGCTPTKVFSSKLYTVQFNGFQHDTAVFGLDVEITLSSTIQVLRLLPLSDASIYYGYNTTSVNWLQNSNGFSTDLQYYSGIILGKCISSQVYCTSTITGQTGGFLILYAGYSYQVKTLIAINTGSYVYNSVTYQVSTSILTTWISQFFGITYQSNKLTAGTSLKVGEYIISNSGCYKATLLSSGNFVIYDSKSAIIWQSNTANKPATKLSMQEDGNLVLYNEGVTPASVSWSTGTYGNCNVYALMQDDGNFVLYVGVDVFTNAVWKTNTNRASPAKC